MRQLTTSRSLLLFAAALLAACTDAAQMPTEGTGQSRLARNPFAGLAEKNQSCAQAGGTRTSGDGEKNGCFPAPSVVSLSLTTVDAVFASLPFTVRGHDFRPEAILEADAPLGFGNVVVQDSTTMAARLLVTGGASTATPAVWVTTWGGPSNAPTVAVYSTGTAPLSLGTARGGNGGSPYVIDCPDNTVATGMNLRGGTVVDRIQLICQSVTGTDRTFGEIMTSASAGGNGGSAATVTCPAGYVMVGVSGRIGNNGNGFNDQIAASCRSLTTDATYTTNAVGRNNYGSIAYTETCPLGLALTGMQGGAGNAVDRSQIRCR